MTRRPRLRDYIGGAAALLLLGIWCMAAGVYEAITYQERKRQ